MIPYQLVGMAVQNCFILKLWVVSRDMEQKHLPTSISMGNLVEFLIPLITYNMGLHFMPGLVDLVSTPANGAAKTCKPIFLPIYWQVKSKHSKWDQGTMQQRCAALLPRSSIRSVGMFLKKKVLPLLHKKNCTSSPKTKKRRDGGYLTWWQCSATLAHTSCPISG